MRSKGWNPDTPDMRDHRYAPRKLGRQTKAVDLRNRFFKPWQQGSLGSCTAHAVGAAVQFLDIYDDDMDIVTPSRLFMYWCARSIEGTSHTDAGVEIRNAIKAVSKCGYPAELSWAYVVSRFKEKPPARAFKAARRELITDYSRVERKISHFRRLIAEGLPVVLGLACYESIDAERVSRTGRIPMPKKSEKMTGGHAVLAVGYDDSKRCLIIRNSWGIAWGQGGYGFLPYDFIESPDLSDDFWVIRR